jgi:hypothetical protein
MAEGDIFGAVPANTESTKRAALAALARGGTQAKDAYLAGLKAQQDDKGAILRDILDRATALNAPEAAASMQATAAPALDRRAAALTSARGSSADLFAALDAAHRNYFDEVNAATPIVQARAQQALADAAAKKAETDGGIAAILKELGGVGMAKGYAETYQGDPRFVPQTQVVGADKNFAPVAAKPGTFNFNGVLKPRTPTAQESADDFGNAVGLPPGAGRALLGAPRPAAKPTQAAHRADVLGRVAQHASPGTADAVQRTLAISKSLADALTNIADTSDADLKKNGVSRAALTQWVRDYYAV